MALFDIATRQFLRVGPQQPKPLPGDARTTSLRITTPGRWVDGPEARVSVHARGSGPAALLVHGWRSQAADLQGVASVLVEAGFTVWMPDLPGHGHSSGEHLAMPLAAAALQAVQAASGPFAVAVGHSYGAACLVHALAGGLAAERVALLAPPTHYGRFARRAAVRAGMPEPVLDAWLDRLAAVIGLHPDEIDMKRQAAGLTMPALLAHSHDDPVTSFADAAEVARAWRGASWLPLEGLGHFRLLEDRALWQALGEFAKGALPDRQH